eukprot:TRINITY_DN13664_c0_g1_i1.p1 TRINITY_DN13664_c0_g1~~TRINITY_DN13664_c0_g1_i1.p1  ORF type:complete len:140 (+),score=65.53 TRINITY_DN13664_c0_g1_i1:165-584(+)
MCIRDRYETALLADPAQAAAAAKDMVGELLDVANSEFVEAVALAAAIASKHTELAAGLFECVSDAVHSAKEATLGAQAGEQLLPQLLALRQLAGQASSQAVVVRVVQMLWGSGQLRMCWLLRSSKKHCRQGRLERLGTG